MHIHFYLLFEGQMIIEEQRLCSVSGFALREGQRTGEWKTKWGRGNKALGVIYLYRAREIPFTTSRGKLRNVVVSQHIPVVV